MAADSWDIPPAMGHSTSVPYRPRLGKSLCALFILRGLSNLAPLTPPSGLGSHPD